MCAGLLAWVLLFAAAAKRRSPEDLRGVLVTLGWMPRSLVTPVTIGLPVAEAICGVFLLVPATRALAGWMAATLLVAFSATILPVIVRGRNVKCGCFGSNASLPMSWATVFRNGVLLAVAVLVGIGGRSTQAEGVAVPALLVGLAVGFAVVLQEQWRASVGPHWMKG